MGVRLFGYNLSGNRTDTLDVGVNRVVKSGASVLEVDSPGALACCLYVYSSNVWVPCDYDWLA